MTDSDSDSLAAHLIGFSFFISNYFSENFFIIISSREASRQVTYHFFELDKLKILRTDDIEVASGECP